MRLTNLTLRHFVNPSTGIVAFVKVVEVDFGTSRGLVERSLTVPAVQCALRTAQVN